MRHFPLRALIPALALAAGVPVHAVETEEALMDGGAPVVAPALGGGAQGGGALRSEADMPLDPRFSGERIKADIAFLADDLLQGRDVGSIGHEIAARFVAQRFAALGLVPMGDVGADGQRGWLQRITFQKTEYAGPAGMEIIGPKGKQAFEHGKEVMVGLNPNEPHLDVSAPLVFVGYGIDNAALGMDDYAGLEVKGKIVVVLSGYPAGMASEEGAHLSATKAQMAQAHGAVGVITLPTNARNKVRPWAKALQYAFYPSFAWVGPDGKVNEGAPGIRIAGTVGDEAAQALLAGGRRSLAQIRAEADLPGGRPKGFALKTSLRAFVEAKGSRVTSPNVVAMLPGGDAKLKDQVVVLSGHLDHLGVSEAKAGEAPGTDHIYNGAMDNAAGTATTLEVARVMAADKVAPRRSVVFLISTAEEKGLLGADYYANFPTVPAASIVGNVDLDMPVLLYPFTDVIAYGADHSTLGPIVAKAVAPMGVSLSPDPMPAETIFVRSDHYRFVRKGVPAVFLATGWSNGGGKIYGEFLAKTYHQPADDMNQAWDWRAGARFAEANWRITRAMADGDVPPLWFKRDFFGATFAEKAQKAAR